MNMKTTRCTECGEMMELSTVTSKFMVKGKELTIKGLEAFVCPKCGEYVYTSSESKMIERIIDSITSTPIDQKSILNLEETAGLLRVSNQTVYNMIRDGRIKAYKIGREWRFLQSDILSFMDSATNTDAIAAKGGGLSNHDMKIIMEEIDKRKKHD